jgi:hypothetical protein
MSELIRRAQPDGVTNVRPSERRLDLRLVAWDDVARSTDEGYPEQLLPGVFAGADPSRVTLESQKHGGAIVGVAEKYVERSDGAYATVRVAETPAGDELLALVTPGPKGEPPVLRDVSVVFRPIKSRTSGGIVQRIAADLRRIAIVERGAYTSGAVLAVRSENEMSDQDHNTGATPDEPEQGSGQTPDTPERDSGQAPDRPAAAAVVHRSEPSPAIVHRIDELEERITRAIAAGAVPAQAGQGHELARHATLSDYVRAVHAGQADQDLLARTLTEVELRRAAAENVTANNAGVLPPSWIQDVKRIVDLGRRAITAFGGPASLGETGMEIDWPYLSSSNTVVGQQTEASEATTARIDIDKGSSSLVTYAGYSKQTYQLLQRSSPSYREAWNRIMLAEWGKVTDAAFCAALEAASGTTTQVAGAMLGANKTLSTSAAADDIVDATAHGLSNGDAIVFTALTGGTGVTAGRVYWVIADNLTADDFQFSATPGGAAVDFTADITAGTVAKVTDTGAKFRAALAQASVSVEDATGQPAGIVLAGTDIFLMLAGLSGFVGTEPSGNPSNADGTVMASTLRIESSGLLVQRAPGVSSGKLVVSNREAASWHEDGPKYATSEDVGELGQYAGVYSFAAPAVYVPAGVVELTLV